VRTAQYAHVGELRGITSNGVSQSDPTFLDEHKSGNGGDWLRHGGNPENRVPFDWQIGFYVPPPDADGLDFSITPHESGHAGELFGIYDLLQCRFDFASSIHFSEPPVKLYGSYKIILL